MAFPEASLAGVTRVGNAAGPEPLRGQSSPDSLQP